jgi:E3 SUMO-protein ligase RanBP2
MRREQVFKICLNHALTTDLIFKSKDERSWLWTARDFSEGEGVVETLVIRFRAPQEAKNFMDAVDNAKQKLGKAPAPPSAFSSTPDGNKLHDFE